MTGRPPVRAASPQVYAVTTATAPTPSSQAGPAGTRAATSAARPPATTSSQRLTKSRFWTGRSAGTVPLGSGEALGTICSRLRLAGTGSGAAVGAGDGSTARSLTRP